MAQKKATQSVTTDRAGPVRLVLGCVLIAVGVAWTLSLMLGTVSAWFMLRVLRDTAHGLGGALCYMLPVFALLGGALLCASARRRVSARAYLAALGMYLCLAALVTLATSVSSRDNTLMNYIANNAKNTLNLWDNTSYGAYLTGAYHLRAFNSGVLMGGGLLGMLLAYPVYAVFNIVGGVTLLALIMLVLLLVMLRVNPVELLGSISERRYNKRNHRQKADGEAPPLPINPAQPAVAAPMTAQADAAQQPQKATPRRHAVQPIIPQQQVVYTTSVLPDPAEGYLVPEEPLPPAFDVSSAPEKHGFAPVTPDALYPEHIPVGDDDAPAAQGYEQPPLRNGAAASAAQQPITRRGQRTAKHAAAAPQSPASPQTVAVDDAAPPWDDDTPYKPPLIEQQVMTTPVVTPPKAAKHASGHVRQVFTDPAVELTGERIPISQGASATAGDQLAPKRASANLVRAATGAYAAPPLSMMEPPARHLTDHSQEDADRAAILEHTLSSFGIDARVKYVVHGPTITRFAISLADGINANRLNPIAKNIAMDLKTIEVRLEVPIPGTNLAGIEVPNEKVEKVMLSEVLDSPAMRSNPSPTAVAIGKDITGKPIICELADMPHLLIAGATGSGKSVCINAIIQSLLFRATPEQVRLLLIDPKVVELMPYNGVPHLLMDVVNEPKKAVAALSWAVQEMQERYRRFEEYGQRNMTEFNKMMKRKEDRMPSIVVIIDEFYNLMVTCRKEVEENIQSLASQARAAGIYMVVATQRPSVDAITGVIKANIPSRIAFAVATRVDSATIIDIGGAEKLLGRGDMLYCPGGELRPLRVQGCFVSDKEVRAVTKYVKEHNDTQYDESIIRHMESAAAKESEQSPANADPEFQQDTENEMLQRAIDMAVDSGQMSISMLRRRLGLGHSRAGKLIDTMVSLGIISQDEGPKPRKTLISREEYMKMQAEILDQ